MNKPSKCKNCQWYGKPYWSTINPCDNCPNENDNVEILTRWQDPTIKEYKKEIDRLNNIINELEGFIKHRIKYLESERKEFEEDFYNDIKTNRDEIYFRNMEIAQIGDILDKLKELKEGK